MVPWAFDLKKVTAIQEKPEGHEACSDFAFCSVSVAFLGNSGSQTEKLNTAALWITAGPCSLTQQGSRKATLGCVGH